MTDQPYYQIRMPLADFRQNWDLYHNQFLLAVDRQDRIILCSAVTENLLGRKNAELAGEPLTRWVRPGGIRQLYERHFRSRPADKPLPDIVVETADGRLVLNQYMIFAVHTDENEEFYLLLIQSFQQQRGRMLLCRFADELLRHFSLGVLLIDANFVLVDISDMACWILGVERWQVLNRPMEEVFAGVPSEHQLVQRSILDGIMLRNHAVSWTNNQDRYELLLDSNLLRNEKGEIEGAYVIFKDVTNLRSLEQQVQRSDRLAMIGQIAAGTAHEIRNPLTSIKGFLQMLNRSFRDSGQQKEHEFTKIMLKEIGRINDLVNEFLLLSKPKDIVYTPVDIQSVLRDILPIIQNEAILHDIMVEYHPAPSLPAVIADRELLKQVFLNICKNGIEAMNRGGKLTVVERLDRHERFVHIDVHDNGPGIPAYLIDKIFDPFFTTKEEGTGLGLSVCQRIIHDIGGMIRVSSKGFGTTFTVSIPYSSEPM